MDGYSTDYDMEGDEDMQQMLAVMPSLTALPLASSFPQPPATDSGAGLQELQPSPMPPSTFPSMIGPALLRQDATHGMLPAFEAVQVEKVTLSPKTVVSSGEEDELPRLETVVLMPHVDVLMPSTGLLTFSMDQLHAALDSHLQMFTAMAEDQEKKEKEKKEGKDDVHVGQDVTLKDGQNKDAANGEEKGGGPSTTV